MSNSLMHEGGAHLKKRLLAFWCVIAFALALQMMMPMLAGATNFSITVQDENGNQVPNVRVAASRWGWSDSSIDIPNDSPSAINFVVLSYWDYMYGAVSGTNMMYSWDDYYLEVSAPGYETKYISKKGISELDGLGNSSGSYFSVSGPDIELGTVKLRKTGLIKGKITNQSGKAVPYAQVLLYNTFEPDSACCVRAHAEEDGTYSIAVPEGSYRLIAYDSSRVYVPTFFGDTQLLRESTLMNTSVTEDYIADIKMLKSGTIRGKVTDFESNGLEGVKVYAENYSQDDWYDSRRATTDASGEYCVTRLQSGKYSVDFSKMGYVHKYYDGSNEGTENSEEQGFVKVSLGNTAINCSASLDKNPVVSGTVKDGGGNPLSNIHVVFYDMDGNGSSAHGVYTDEQGNYTTESLKEGSYRVGFQDPYNKEYATKYYADKPNVFSIENANTITVQNNSTYTNIDGVMTERLHSVDGRIVDEDGHPVSGLRVSLYRVDGYGDSAHWAETNADGWYFIEGVDSGKYYVGVHDFVNRTYATAYYGNTALFDDAKEVAITNTSLSNINMTVKSRGYIKGKVVDQDGKPIPNLTIAYVPDEYDSGASSHSVLSAKDGTYMIKGADAGKGTLRFSDFYAKANNLLDNRPNGFYATQYYDGKLQEYAADKLKVKAGEVTEVGITKIFGRHKAELIFKDENGNILPNQKFYFYGRGLRSGWHTADINGRYIFEGLDNGYFSVEVDEHGVSFSTDFTIENQDVTCVVGSDRPKRISSSAEGIQTFHFGYQVDINIPEEDKSLFDDAYLKGSIWQQEDLRGLELSLNFKSAVAKPNPYDYWSPQFTQDYFIDGLPEYVTADITLPEEFNLNAPGVRVKFSGLSGTERLLQQTPLGEPTGDACYALLAEDGSKIRIYTKERISLNIDSLRTVGWEYQNGDGGGSPEAYGSLISHDSEFPKENNGKIITGWYTDKERTHQWDFSKDRVFDDFTLYAKVVPVRTVAFESNGGSEVESQRVGEGELIGNVAPARSNYTFAGWYKDSELTQAWDMAEDRVSESIVLYAKWAPNSYSISYVTNGGTMPNGAKKSYEYGEEFSLAAPERAGYSFAGWYGNGDFEGAQIEKVTSTDTGKLYVYAKWAPRTYALTFDFKGGVALENAPTTYEYGTEKALPVPTREHYNFAGWYDDADFSGTPYASVGLKNPGDLTLIAKWNAKKYTVVFDSRGGSAIQPQDVEYNALATRPTDPTRAGYTFAGWYKDSACTNDFGFNTIIEGYTIAYAKWVPQTYQITFQGNGGSVSGVRLYTFGSCYTLPTPSRSGYTFKGWYASSNFGGNPTNEVSAAEVGSKTFYAKWHSDANYIPSMSKSTGTWSKSWTKTRLSNTLKIASNKSNVKLKANHSAGSKVYFKYVGGSYSNATDITKTIKVLRGKSKTVYMKVVSQSGKGRTYKIVISRKR